MEGKTTFMYICVYHFMCMTVMLKLSYDSQGSEVVREMPVPEELIFTVDERVRRDIALAKEQYYKSVSNTHTVLSLTSTHYINQSLLYNHIMH